MNPRIALFGKLPAAGDFVAFNEAYPVARQLDKWLQAGVDHVVRRGKELPQSPVRFLYRDPACSGACIGVFVPSHDRVGRKFPLAAFAYIDMPVAVHRFPYLPAAYAPFLDGAAAVLSQAAQAEPNAIMQHLSTLVLPAPQELEEARVWGYQALDATSGRALVEALFGPAAKGVAFHGFNMFLSACAQVHGGAPAIANTVLECSASDDVQLVFWLRLAYELLAWQRAPPSLFWSGGDSRDNRLMLTLGSPDAAVLHYLADPHLRSERLWPTLTDNSQSIEHGRTCLGPTVVKALEPPAPTASHIIAALLAPPPTPVSS
ncbi:MAG: type VI secretion system-associated protein TagF [Deltaproteobacteria bacterium]|nr:type VI secretion system-associated protein TagF [Deltaproteobacteria bacterium]